MTRIIHATGCYGVLGTHSDHGGLGDGYICVLVHLLEEFLLTDTNGKSAAGIDGLIGGVEVSVDLGLRDCHVVVHDVVVDVADDDPVEDLIGVLECGNHPFVEYGGTNVGSNAAGVDILGPVDIQYLVLCT